VQERLNAWRSQCSSKISAPDTLTRWLKDGIIVGDWGYLSQAPARELTQRGVYLLTTTRKTMRKVASQFQLACLQLRHRVEELFAFGKGAFGAAHDPSDRPRLARSLAVLFTGLLPV
jgi:Transposase DDE domain